MKIKEKVTQAEFEYYIKMKESHSKLSEVQYMRLTMQSYLKSEVFNN